MNKIVPSEVIENKIFLIKGRRVMIDRDLAELYGVETKYLTRQVRRNIKRFPPDLMFRLTKGEFLRCQNVTSKRGGRRYLPYVFTEQGVAMLSTVLNSERAIYVNIVIMRAFVKIREILSMHKELAQKLNKLERKIENHDAQIQGIFEAIRRLMAPPSAKPKQRMGFHP